MNTGISTRALVLLLGVAIMAHPGVAKTDPGIWAALQRTCAEEGLDAKLVKEIVARCEKQGIDVQDAHAMLMPALDAAKSDLPRKPILEKIAEGLAKSVPPATIAEVAHQRVRYLHSCRDMLQSIGEKLVTEATISAAAQALESGLDGDGLRSIVEAARDLPTDDLTALLEAGEALYLAGFGSDEIQPILADCVARRLNRVELKRAIRYASQQKQRGMETGRIRQALWGGDGAAQQNRHREQHGEGGGTGPGMGGPHHGHGRP